MRTTVFFLGLFGLTACGGGVSPADASELDVAPSETGTVSDTGNAIDSGARDSETRADASVPVDSISPEDATAPRDAGTTVDSSGPPDATAIRDASASADASPPGDSGLASSPAGVGAYTVTRASRTITGASVVVFDPALATGDRAPLVLFKHGFQLSTTNYQATLTRIASHGYVVVSVDSGGGLFGGPTQVAERDQVIAAVGWALSPAAPFAAHLDGEHVAVIGHSRGGKVAVMVAAADTRIDAILGLDPVNSCGPGASYSADCPDVTAAGIAPSLAIPAGYMGETADGTGGFMPCAPVAQNYATVYNATTAAPSATEWTFTDAAHMTFTDDGGGFAGSLCATASGDTVMIRESIRTLAVAFLDRHLRADASRDVWLTGRSLPTDVSIRTR